MKFIVYLCLLVLCAACALPGLPAVEPSATPVTAPPSPVAIQPTATHIPALPTEPAALLPTPTALFNTAIDNIAAAQPGQLYASGSNLGDDLRHFAQWDGAKWIELGQGFKTAGNSLAVDRAGHLFTEIITDSDPCMAIMLWDGAKWNDITANFGSVVDALKPGRVSCNVPVMALAMDGADNLYATGTYYYPSADHTAELAMSYLAKWNKESWTVLGQGFDRVNIFGLAVAASGKVYVSGEQPLIPAGETNFTGFLAEWDGEQWAQIDTSKLRSCSTIANIALDRSEGLYASCKGNDPGGSIFYWDRTDWITITTQLGGEAPAVYDMAVDDNGQLCIGDSFDSVSGVPAKDIACWDGSRWRALGEGVNERVNALAFDPGGELIAVGFFTKAGGLSVEHAARWDGETWHALGQ